MSQKLGRKKEKRKLEVENLLVEQGLENAFLLLHVLVKVLQELIDLAWRLISLNIIKRKTEMNMMNFVFTQTL